MNREPIFTPEFLADLPDDRLDAAMAVGERYFKWASEHKHVQSTHYFEIIDAYAAAEVLATKFGWDKILRVDVSNDPGTVINQINGRFSELLSWAQSASIQRGAINQYEESKARYDADIKSPFEFRFDPTQLEDLQRLVNEIRKELTELQNIPEQWRRRMLRKLEGLQRELHERMSNMDKFWGFVGEAIPVLYAIGVAGRPLVNRIREFAEIGLRIHATFFGLAPPPGVPMLPPGETDPDMPSLPRTGNKQIARTRG